MKMIWLISRIRFAILQFPKRLVRLFTYPFSPFYFPENGGSRFRTFPLLLADCLFLIDTYEIFTNLYKTSARPLTQREILRGREIFGKSIDFQVVMIDGRAKWLTRSMGVIYVGANTINSWGAFPDDYLIHELVHVWQYQHFGAGYVACALKAQGSPAGYNYTYTSSKIQQGIKNESWFEKPSFLNFNAEQQGDLVQDYFKIKNGFKAEWCDFGAKDLSKIEKYILEMKAMEIN